MIKLRYIAPSGTPISILDLIIYTFDCITKKNRSHELKQAICYKYNIKHCFLMSSARAAMAMLFVILKKNTSNKQRNEIILPSYTCYSVPAAAEIADLKVRICDINPQTLGYDLDQLNSVDFSNVLAIVTANLYGNPDDLSALEAIASKHNVILLDDSAQSMNARIDGRYAGTFGDIGLYSLDKGKNITSIQGGIIVTNNDKLAELIKLEIDKLPEPSFKQKIVESIKLVIYSILLRPWLYWIPANISALGLGNTIYTTDYLFTKYSKHLASISFRLFSKIDKITSQRCQNAKKIRNALNSVTGIEQIKILDNANSCCLRLAIIINDSEARNKLIESLHIIGIGATPSYPMSIAELNEVSKFTSIHNHKSDNGQYIAKHIITIPTSPYLNNSDIFAIKKLFIKHLVTNI